MVVHQICTVLDFVYSMTFEVVKVRACTSNQDSEANEEGHLAPGLIKFGDCSIGDQLISTTFGNLGCVVQSLYAMNLQRCG